MFVEHQSTSENKDIAIVHVAQAHYCLFLRILYLLYK